MGADGNLTRRTAVGFRPFLPALALSVLVLLVLGGSSAWFSSSASPAGRWAGADRWTNGVLSVTALPNDPAVTVSGQSDASTYGLYVGLGGVTEVAGNGTPTSKADMSGVAWGFANRTSASAYDIAYRAQVPVVPLAQGATGGSATVYINFSASGLGSSRNEGSTAVAMHLALSGWPWTNPADLLALSMPLWPNDSRWNYMVPVPPGGHSLSCNSNESKLPVEYFDWASNASGSNPGGATVPLSAASQVNGSGSFATVSVQIPKAPTGYSLLQFDGQVALALPSPAPSIPTSSVAAVGIAGALGSLALAGFWRSVWKRAPSLESVEESDEET